MNGNCTTQSTIAASGIPARRGALRLLGLAGLSIALVATHSARAQGLLGIPSHQAPGVASPFVSRPAAAQE